MVQLRTVIAGGDEILQMRRRDLGSDKSFLRKLIILRTYICLQKKQGYELLYVPLMQQICEFVWKIYLKNKM